MRRSTITVVCVAAAIAGGLTVHHKWKFPYGWSHCCINEMMFALEQYASDNAGKYPTGEASPEASLSLLYRSNYIDAPTLRGMTVPEKKVRAILQGGGLLGPDSCGWHYVPGLTRADDPGLALLWCKTALGHFGERIKDGSRQVLFVRRDIAFISGDKWPGFLEDQRRLLAKRTPREVAGLPLITATIELPDGNRIDRLDCVCTVTETTKGPNFSSSGTSSGSPELVWLHAPFHDGYVTRILSFSNLISDSVTVRFTNGVPDATNVIFRMRSTR